MTREKEIDVEATHYDYGYYEGDRISAYMCFRDGAIWADENPKSPWISVEEDLPIKHTKSLYEVIELRYQATELVLIRTEENIYDVSFMYNDGHGWQWECELGKVTHWMPIPEPPHDK